MSVPDLPHDGNVLILVRHTKVEDQYKNVCYGASDIGLSAEGEAHARDIAASFSHIKADRVFHSGLKRSRLLAEMISSNVNAPAERDDRLAEMNFGAWELKSWDRIFAEVGHDISRLTAEPDSFAPPGGETVHAVRDRVVAWARELPKTGCIVAVSHGGAISALRRTLSGAELNNWTDFVPAHGEILSFELPLFASLQM